MATPDGTAAEVLRRRANSKKWRDANPEKELERCRKYNDTHREQRRESSRKRNTLRRLADPEKARKESRTSAERFASDPSNRMRLLLRYARTRANRLGLEFDSLLSKLTETLPKKCACCGMPLDYSRTTRRERAPSLDRVDNARGYLADNVRVVCCRCNVVKRDATLGELESIVAYMRRCI